MNNKRKHPRKTAAIPVELTLQSQAFEGSILDISTGGAFIEIDDMPVQEGNNISLNLACLSYGQPFVLEGRVVSKRPSGIGVTFDQLSENQRNRLSYLYY